MITLSDDEVASLIETWGVIDFSHTEFETEWYQEQNGKTAMNAELVEQEHKSTSSYLASIEKDLSDTKTLDKERFKNLCDVAEDLIEWNITHPLPGSPDGFTRWLNAVSQAREAAQEGRVQEKEEVMWARLPALFLKIKDIQMQSSQAG